MGKYYIVSIHSLDQSFTILDSGKRICFGFSNQSAGEVFDSIHKGDMILGYVGHPTKKVKYAFEVMDDEENIVELIKLFDVELGASLPYNIDKNALEEEGSLLEISEEIYQETYNEILDGAKFIQNGMESDDLYGFDINTEVTAAEIPVSYNYLVFGAPGTGKSNALKRLQEAYFKEENAYERVTFHSNYSYANFVGTYKPKMMGKDITYSFVPGPFIRILERAYREPHNNFLLIIEEINRANPAAVFGDVLQLLDRENGKSEYSIETSEELRERLASELVDGYSKLTDENDIKFVHMQFKKISIPRNMYIWASMNSADQGVFPMDTAFKRRWDYDYIGINDNSEGIKNVNFYAGETDNKALINWDKLRRSLNKKLHNICKVNEDKLIGPYFLSKDIMKLKEDGECVADNEKFLKAFKSKVIMYLFEDAAKQRKSDLFSNCGEPPKYSSICEEFNRRGIAIFGYDVKNEVLGRE